MRDNDVRVIDAIDVEIQEIEYTLIQIHDPSSVADEIWRVIRQEEPKQEYTVSRENRIWYCECGDYHWKRDGLTAEGCKHIEVVKWVRDVRDELRSGVDQAD